jgi:hypothetical protein
MKTLKILARLASLRAVLNRTAIDNIFVDSIRFSSTSTSPIINDLSDHDARYLMINNIAAATNLIPFKQRKRKVKNETIMQFQILLKSETWESVYKDNDTNNKFNSFFYTFLNIFEASFPINYKSLGKIKNDWITQGIKVSCKHKRSLYIYSTVGTVMIQTQEHFILSIVKSLIML